MNAEPIKCANGCGETSERHGGQFLPNGDWVCSETCKRSCLAYEQSMSDLAASGGIVDAP